MESDIPSGSRLHASACKLLDAAQEFWIARQAADSCAVVWLEDADGRVLLYTRGEYRDTIMAAVGSAQPTRLFVQP